MGRRNQDHPIVQFVLVVVFLLVMAGVGSVVWLNRKYIAPAGLTYDDRYIERHDESGQRKTWDEMSEEANAHFGKDALIGACGGIVLGLAALGRLRLNRTQKINATSTPRR